MPELADANTVDSSPAEPPPPGIVQDERVLDVIGRKILNAWLRNRYQLLFSFTLDLKKLSERHTELLAGAMVAAAHADGNIEEKERERLNAAWKLINADGESARFLGAALDTPKSLNELLSDVDDMQSAALVYAASLLVIDRRSAVHRYYLRYLAARLKLSRELIEGLQQQFGR